MSNEMQSFFHQVTHRFVFITINLFTALVAIFTCKVVMTILAGMSNMLHRGYAVKVRISSTYFISLLNLGTLCWPPNFPLLRSHEVNVPFFTW